MNKQKNLATLAAMTALASPIAMAEEKEVETKTEKPDISLFTKYVSKSVYPNGYISGDAALQNYVGLDLGKGLAAFVWSNFDLKTQKFDEVDLGLTYTRKLAELLGGDVSVNTALKQWYFPSGKLGENSETALAVDFLYSGAIDANVRFSQVLTGEKWGFIDGSISKTFETPYETTITPGLGFGFTFDGETLGDGITLAQIMPKIDFSKSFDDWNATLNLSYQFGKDGAEDAPYVGLGFGTKF